MSVDDETREEAVERCGCPESEVYRKALKEIIAYAQRCQDDKSGGEHGNGVEMGAESAAIIAREALDKVALSPKVPK